jgi:hypothetical protein
VRVCSQAGCIKQYGIYSNDGEALVKGVFTCLRFSPTKIPVPWRAGVKF